MSDRAVERHLQDDVYEVLSTVPGTIIKNLDLTLVFAAVFIRYNRLSSVEV